MTQPQQVLLSEVTTFPNVALDVVRGADGSIAITADVLDMHGMPGKRLVFPMSVEYAESLGKKLTAPRVVVPNGNGHDPRRLS